MIRAFYGLSQNPFSTEGISLLNHQQEIYDTLSVLFQASVVLYRKYY